jgi:hypothetical protein
LRAKDQAQHDDRISARPRTGGGVAASPIGAILRCIGIDRPADYDDFKAEVLADQEADSQGVYEVWWAANGRYPDLSLSARLAIAESVVNELLRDGRISLVRGKWIGPDHKREPIADSEAALRAWSTWVPQPDEPVVWMADV